MKIKQIILVSIGFLALAFGFIGVVLPILPTTPFVILAAICFSGSSPRCAALLMKSKYFGSYIDNYYHKTGVPAPIKKRAIVYLWGALILSMVIVHNPMVIGILVIVGMGVSFHIGTLKTKIE